MTTRLLLTAVAVLVGGVVPIQAVVNSRLGEWLGRTPEQKLTATWISFLGGTIGITVLLLFVARGLPRLQNSPLEAPPLLWTGGLYGVVFVSASIMLVPRIGVAATVGAMLCGQMINSVWFDHIAFLGTPRSSVTPMRIGGLVLMMVGLLMVSQKPEQPTTAPTATDSTATDSTATDSNTAETPAVDSPTAADPQTEPLTP